MLVDETLSKQLKASQNPENQASREEAWFTRRVAVDTSRMLHVGVTLPLGMGGTVFALEHNVARIRHYLQSLFFIY
jgi:hypothetical protein